MADLLPCMSIPLCAQALEMHSNLQTYSGMSMTLKCGKHMITVLVAIALPIESCSSQDSKSLFAQVMHTLQLLPWHLCWVPWT